MRIRHLLAATDGSAAGTHAVAMGRILAGRLGATLMPLRVESATPLPGSDGPGAPEPEGTAIVHGLPAIEIVRYADLHACDLILLGRSALPRQAARALGDTRDAVIRRAHVPCLVVPQEQDHLARLLVALDGSERGMAVMRSAWGLRRLSGDGVSAIFVESEEPDLSAKPAATGPSTRGLRVQRAIREIVGGREPPPLIQRRGDQVTEVLHGLSAAHGEVLAVGVRRHGPAGVSESTGVGRRLIAAAPCAVLTIPL